MQLTPVKPTQVKQPKEEEFPTLGSSSIPKRLLVFEETETSGNQSSEQHREKEAELCLTNLSSLDRLVFEKLKEVRDHSQSIIGLPRKKGFSYGSNT